MFKSLQTMIVPIAVAVMALSAPLDNAEAKRRIGGSWGTTSKKAPKAEKNRNGTSLPIVIPGVALGSSTKKPIEVVKVADLPNVADFQREDGSYVDLGWRFLGETDGEWVGYIGSDHDYLTVSPEQLTAIMQIAGIEKLPEPPKRIGQSVKKDSGDHSTSGGALWTLLQIAAAIFLLRVAKRRLLPKSEVGEPDGAAEVAADWLSKPESTVAAASSPRMSSPMRASTVVRGGPSGFGRRA
jgi:hypothetical protein